jgi:hypothetical protein
VGQTSSLMVGGRLPSGSPFLFTDLRRLPILSAKLVCTFSGVTVPRKCLS